jgi:hypothetical protein
VDDPYANTFVPYAGPATLAVGFDATTSNTSTTGASLWFDWTLVSSPTTNAPLDLVGVPVLDPTFPQPSTTATLSMNVGGVYTVELAADQGCGQEGTIQKTITLQCDATITPSFAPNGTYNVNWDNNTGGWPNTVLTPGTFANTFSFGQWPTQTVANNLGLQSFTWYQDGAFLTSTGTSTPISIPPSGTNSTSSIEMWASDGCTYMSGALARVNITWHCYDKLNALITSNATNLMQIPTGSLVNFFSNSSTLSGPPGTNGYFWSVTSWPADFTGSLPTSNIATFDWTPTWGGVYVVTLIIGDGCTSSTVSVTVQVQCTVTLPLQARALSADGVTPATFTWNRNNFGQVLLDSNGTRPTVINGISYTWKVLNAPQYSIFYPLVTTTSDISNTTTANTTSQSADGYYTIWESNLTYTETNTTWTQYVVLVNKITLQPTTAFPSCFYPDIAGTYQVELTAIDSCQQQVSVINVPVNCASKPTPQIAVTEHALFNANKESPYVTNQGGNSWKIQLSRSAPRRVLLDARSSIQYSNSQMSYYWGWAIPDPRADTPAAQDELETPYASTSALTIKKAGKYHLFLTVHDGCDVNYLNFTLDAQCSEPDQSLGPNVTVNSDGRNLNTFQLSMKQGDQQIQCSSNTWTFYNFTMASTSGGSQLTISLFAIFLFSLFALFVN